MRFQRFYRDILITETLRDLIGIPKWLIDIVRCEFHCILVWFALFFRLNSLISLKSELGCANGRKCITKRIVTVAVDNDRNKWTYSLWLLNKVQRSIVIRIWWLYLIVLNIVRQVIENSRAIFNKITFTTKDTFDRSLSGVLTLFIYTFGSFENMRERLNYTMVSNSACSMAKLSCELDKIGRIRCSVTLAHLGMHVKFNSLALCLILPLRRFFSAEESWDS